MENFSRPVFQFGSNSVNNYNSEYNFGSSGQSPLESREDAQYSATSTVEPYTPTQKTHHHSSPQNVLIGNRRVQSIEADDFSQPMYGRWTGIWSKMSVLFLPSETSLSSHDKVKKIEELILHGGDVNKVYEGFSPLYGAILFADFEAAKFLLRAGADPLNSNDPRTPFDILQRRNWTENTIEQRGELLSLMGKNALLPDTNVGFSLADIPETKNTDWNIKL